MRGRPITRSPDHARSPDLKRMFQIWRLSRKQLCSILRDEHVVFQTYAKFTADINSRLVTECHIRRKQLSIAADKIRPLMPIHANAMPHAMSKVLVVWAIACLSDDFSRCGIHRLA